MCRVEESDLESLEWLTKDGERKPTLKIVVHGETIELPLRDAPFCHLLETKKCDCFILRKAKNGSKWEIASFVRCDDNVRGDFMNSSHYFEIAPKKDGKPGEHIIKNHIQEENVTETSMEMPDNMTRNQPLDDQIDFKYLKPFPEYGQLFENETGYITVIFVVSTLLFEFVPEGDVDQYLQNYVNDANQYMSQLNMLIIYRGWMTALLNDSSSDLRAGILFITRNRYLSYDNESIHDALFYISPGKSLMSLMSLSISPIHRSL